MALSTQRMNVQFRGGIDSKTNDQLVIPSKLVRAENVELDSDTVQRRKSLQVRAGTDANQLGFVPVRMFTQAGSVVVESQDGVQTRVGGAAFRETQLRMAAQTVRQGSLAGYSSLTQCRAFDSAVDPSGNVLTVREVIPTGGTNVGIQWEVRDSSGVVVSTGNFGGGAGAEVRKPIVRWSVAQSKFYIWCVNSSAPTTALVQRLDPVGMSIVTEFTVTTGSGEQRMLCYDVDVRTFTAGTGGECYGVIACNPRGASQTLYGKLFNLTTNAVIYNNTTTVSTLFSLCAFAGDVDNGAGGHVVALLAFYSKYGDGSVYRQGLGTFGSTWAADGQRTVISQAGQAGRIVVQTMPFDPNNLVLVFDYSSTGSSVWHPVITSVVKLPCIYNSATAVWQVRARGECVLSTRIFNIRDRQALGVTFASNEFQSVFFVLDLTQIVSKAVNAVFNTTIEAPVLARIDWGETVAPTLGNLFFVLDETNRPAQAFQLSDDDVWVPYLSWAANTRRAGGQNITQVALSFVRLDGRSQLGDAPWNGTQVLAGALPMLCDGESIVEEGFSFNPELYSITGAGSGGSGTFIMSPDNTGPIEFPEENKTYTFVFTLAWQDAQGNWYESGYASLGQVTTTTGNKRITPRLALPPTSKTGVQILLYRSLANAQDTTLYLVGALDASGSLTMPTDSDLPSSEVLYTEGGVLMNTPAPHCRHIETYQDRLAVSSGQKVYFSKTRSLGFGAEFVSDQLAFQLNVPASYGRVVGTAAEADTLLVLGESVIGVVYGTGPDNTGSGTFQPITEAIHDRGALWSSPKSIRQTREGVWFHSRDGLRLVAGNQLAVANNMEVGAELDTQLPSVAGMRCVTLTEPGVGGLPQTRFAFTYLFEAGVAFDEIGTYFASWHSMWSQFTVFTNHSCVDAATALGPSGSAYHLLSLDSGDSAVVRYRSTTQSPQDLWVDGLGTTMEFKSLVRTSWIQFAGVEGYQRAKRVLLLGRVLDLTPGVSTMDFELNVRYDFDNDESSFVQEFGVSGQVLTNTFQFWHQLVRQKCEALQLEFAWVPRTAPSTLRLTDIALDIGVKGTFRKAQKL